ncbi:hypothetical protein IAQ61_007370 [Plenodomus lingam]|uniref:uncharacterized protein n=1 Tax=Leptosphaeria maculans TaxID=5022 RepID=UPI0033247877|nr:hypothetical protein IAQ61_007370 [Plenodomus lingam]
MGQAGPVYVCHDLSLEGCRWDMDNKGRLDMAWGLHGYGSRALPDRRSTVLMRDDGEWRMEKWTNGSIPHGSLSPMSRPIVLCTVNCTIDLSSTKAC